MADDLSPHQCAVQIHATVIAFASVFAELAGVTELQEHASQVVTLGYLAIVMSTRYYKLVIVMSTRYYNILCLYC